METGEKNIVMPDGTIGAIQRDVLPAAALREPFSATRTGLICALLSYIMAYAWTGIWTKPLELLLTAALLVLLCEAIQKGVSRSRESLLWLGCFAVCTFSLFVQLLRQYGIYFGGSYLVKPLEGGWESTEYSFCRVWDEYQLALFVHIFAVWWMLSRSGKLLAGQSSRYLPMDAMNAFVIMPFGGFFLRIRTLAFHLRELALQRREASARETEPDPRRRETVFWILLAAVLSLGLFTFAGELLSAADRGFAAWYVKIGEMLRLDWEPDPETVMRFIFSLPVGMYLFGLMDGSRRFRKETLKGQLEGIEAVLASIRRVPVVFWTLVIAVFSLLYLSFFVIQASYLFGAFTRTLPEGFIVSQYAREGFFELCKLMALNFSLLWLVTRMAKASDKGDAGSGITKDSILFRAACLALLAESAVFAVIAFSKLALYIDCFGFTPLRFQSIWLVCVLFAACILWAVNMITGRKVFRYWMYFGAVSLSLLSLY